MADRIEWPEATAHLFTDAAGIAAYIDGEGLDPATAEAGYRRELAEMKADPDMRDAVAEALADQRSAVTAMLDALVHLGAARWEPVMPWGRRQLVIRGPEEPNDGTSTG